MNLLKRPLLSASPLLILLFLLVAGLPLGKRFRLLSGSQMQTPVERGVASLDVQIQSKFKAGQPVVFESKVLNNSRSFVYIWQCGYWPNHMVLIINQEGFEPPLTDAGARAKKSFFNPHFRGGNVCLKLPANSSADLAKTDLSSMYKLNPGTYQLKVLYSDRSVWPLINENFQNGLTMLSNTSQFTID